MAILSHRRAAPSVANRAYRGKKPLPHANSGGCFARFFCQPGYLKTITRAAHGLEVAWALRIGFDFLTDTPHIHIDRPGGHEASIAPDRIQQVVATENPARMPGKIVQQPKLRRRSG